MYNPHAQHSDSHIAGMKIDYMSEGRTLETLWLPEQPEGRFNFKASDSDDNADSFYIEGNGEKWTINCRDNAYISDGHGAKKSMELVDRQFVVVTNNNNESIIYAETILDGSNTYYNYKIKHFDRINIGREADNDIQYAQNVVTRHHATLWWDNGICMITDHGSTNGTYVNGKRISETAIYPGDTIYIVGLRIVLGYGFLSINTAGRNVYINSNKLTELILDNSRSLCSGETSEQESEFFNRSPRRRISMAFEPIQVEAPPMSMNSNKMPLLLRMGSSAVSGGRALFAGQVTTLISSFVFPLLSNKYTEKERKEYEEKRNTMYNKYLDDKKSEIADEISREQFSLNSNYPPLDTVIKYPVSEARLWDRQSTDDDYLTLRVGTGRLPLKAEIDYARKHFSLDEDELEKKMYELCETQFYINNAPVLSSFTEDWVCGVTGDRTQVIAFVRSIVLQLTILHSYDDVKTVFLINPSELSKLNFIRYLPHTWNNSRNFRFIATDINEAYKIGEYLKTEIDEDLSRDQPPKRFSKTRPYYFIFALDKKILESMEIIKSVLQLEHNIGITLLAVFDDLPKECTKVFNINSNGSQNEMIYINQIERASDYFSTDICSDSASNKALRCLFNTSLKILSQSYTLPKSVSFLEMFDVGRVEHLNVLDRWQSSNPIKSLATPVGIGTDGNVFSLNLHEKFQGPHGLVAGMTGSGKSEFLITYILSLAVNYHPNDVSFILIDYKGGGLADAFENKAAGIRLPHLMGTITNLDGSSIQRSLMAIESELRRRQFIFKECKEALGESTMDIYSYQKLFRSGRVQEPLPHLFIISDEFAELKQQQPEFMEKLISAARIGRSLGVHLILATQKPSGVVNDQIRSNTKFRVCLKVQDKADSMDMLKRPEAAELVDVGRFYLQVGYNEYFAMGQSAWCGAIYEPQDEVIEKRDESIAFLDNLGQPTLTVSPEVVRSKSDRSQLTETVIHLSKLAEREGLSVRTLWTPALPNKIDITDLPAGDKIDPTSNICLGILDDPENQKQFPFVFDFKHCGNLLIIGETASGKTTLIQTILYSLASKASPDDVQFYVLDYSSRLLKIFSVLPHCGAVLTEEDSSMLPALFDLIEEIISERKKLFARLEVDSFDAACSEVNLPLIIFVIDGFSGLGNSKEGAAALINLQQYLRDGMNYGIKFVCSCTHLNEVSTRIRQEFGDRICLHMNDKYAYGDALSCRVSYLPPEKPGRGLYKLGDTPLELQCAMCSDGIDVKKFKNCLVAIKDAVKSTTEAKKLPHVPDGISYTDFIAGFKPGRIPLGYFVKNGKPVAIPFAQLKGLSLYFGNEIGIAPIWKNLAEAAAISKMDTLVIRQKNGSCIESNCFSGIFEELDCSVKSISLLYNRLFKLIDSRKTLAYNFCVDNGIDPDAEYEADRIFDYVRCNSEPLLLIIENFEEFCKEIEPLSEDDPLAESKNAAKMMLEAIFKMAGQYNFYIVGGFYPGGNQSIRMNPVYRAFNVDENIMLFGGRANEQIFGIYESSVTRFTERMSCHHCIMKHKNQFYELYVPCDEPRASATNDEIRNIFE